MVTLQTEDQRQMIIGGGAGQYVVCATFGKDEFWSLLRPEPGEGIVKRALKNKGYSEAVIHSIIPDRPASTKKAESAAAPAAPAAGPTGPAAGGNP